MRIVMRTLLGRNTRVIEIGPKLQEPAKVTGALNSVSATGPLVTDSGNVLKAVAADPAPKPLPPVAEPPKAESPKAEPPKAEPPEAKPQIAEPPKVQPPKVQPPKVQPPKVKRFEFAGTRYAHFNQYANTGQKYSCGTTSLSMILNYWNSGKAANYRDTIDSKIRNGDMFAAPDDIVDYARSNGYRAEIKNESSFDDIRTLLDQGVPVQVLIDPGSTGDFNLHYITITGYEKDAAGNVTKVIVDDPAKNARSEMSLDEFVDRWSDLKLGGFSTGMSRVLISMVPGDGRMIEGLDGVSRPAGSISLPKDPWDRMFSDALPALTLAKGWLDLVNGYKTNDAGKIAEGLAHVAASLGPLLINTLVGLPAQESGRKMKDWGKQKMSEGGLGAVIGGAAIAMGELTQKFGWAVTKLCAVTTWVQDKVYGTLVKVGEAVVNGVAKGVTAVAGAVADAATAAWNGVKDVGGAISSGVQSIFSGW